MSPTGAALAATILFLVQPETNAGSTDLDPPDTVFQATGVDAATLTQRGMTCIVKMTNPANPPVQAGTVIRQNIVFEFNGGDGRSTMTFEAKDGRFRISHSYPDEPSDFGAGWVVPVKKIYRRMNAQLAEINAAIANCVTGAGATNDW